MTSLICDDDPVWRRLMRRVLGGTVLEAESIEGALMLAKKTAPHVLLLDVILPDGLGWQAIPRFREVSPRTEIVVVSAMPIRTDGLRSIGHGYRAFAYLDKLEGLDGIASVVRRAFHASVVGLVHERARDVNAAKRVGARS